MIQMERLQLGDIVCHINNDGKKTLCRITQLFISSLWKDAVSANAEAITATDTQRYLCGFANNFEPVPITPAFLMANGFAQKEATLFDEVVSGTDWWLREYPCDGSPIRIGYDPQNYHFRAGNCGNDNCWLSVDAFSVDEFQRLLRFCLRNNTDYEVMWSE